MNSQNLSQATQRPQGCARVCDACKARQKREKEGTRLQEGEALAGEAAREGGRAASCEWRSKGEGLGGGGRSGREQGKGQKKSKSTWNEEGSNLIIISLINAYIFGGRH